MGINKEQELLLKQIKGFIETDPFYLPVLANVSSLLYNELDEVNWVGFYIIKNNQLVLGPFMGKPACIHIPFSKGVCGACITNDEAQVVNDVSKFPNHITCDSDSKSEIVFPIHIDGKLFGVLDIDSPIIN